MINTTVLKETPHGAAPPNAAKATGAAQIRTEIVHYLPGRLRLRSASLRGNVRMSVAARRRLRNIDGFTAVTVNPCAGSLLIEYDRKRLALGDVRRLLDQRGFVVADSQHADEGGRSPLAQVSGVLGRLLADALLDRLVAQVLLAIV